MTTDAANNKLEFKPQIIFEKTKYCKSWDEWLGQTESFLKLLGYVKYEQDYKGESFAYWKIIKENEQDIYQIGLLFYDFRRYGSNSYNISVCYECMIMNVDAGVRLEISDSITLQQFEKVAQTFYESMSQHYPNKK